MRRKFNGETGRPQRKSPGEQLVAKPWKDDELKGIKRDALLQAESA
ncbi:MAG: hypothetical protein HY808_09030 [Nitrospirae bacterium]|nr:hypothetical protein [Nitrospirota bacterium]